MALAAEKAFGPVVGAAKELPLMALRAAQMPADLVAKAIEPAAEAIGLGKGVAEARRQRELLKGYVEAPFAPTPEESDSERLGRGVAKLAPGVALGAMTGGIGLLPETALWGAAGGAEALSEGAGAKDVLTRAAIGAALPGAGRLVGKAFGAAAGAFKKARPVAQAVEDTGPAVAEVRPVAPEPPRMPQEPIPEPQARVVPPEAVPTPPTSPAAPSPPLGASTPEVPAPRTAVGKLTDLIEAGKVQIRKTEGLRTVERGQRAGAFAGALQSGPGGEQGFREASRVLAGEMPQARSALEVPGFGQPDIDEMFNTIRSADLRPFDQKTASEGLVKLLDGSVPQRSELVLLEGLFGRRFTDAARGLTRGEKVWRGVSDALNLPRAVAASLDMSAPLRQGVILSISHPQRAAKAFFQMHKDFFSSRNYEAFTDALKSDPMLPTALDSGLHLASLGQGMKTSVGRAGAEGAGEEVFRSTLAEHIPGVKASERAYVGYLDRMRFDVFKDSVKRLGIADPGDKQAALARLSLAKWINIASGRGSLGATGERVAHGAGQVFFAPRFVASRIQAINPMTYVDLAPEVRKQAVREMVTFASVAAGVTGLAAASGASVVTDMRATDFGKARLGHIRTDLSGGFLPLVRFVSQMAGGTEHLYQKKKGRVEDMGPAWKTGARMTMSGELKPLSGEGPFPETRMDLALKFLRSKLSPPASFAVDLLYGAKNMVGEEMQWGPEVAQAVERGDSPVQIAKTITQTEYWRRFFPMFLQDTAEAMIEEGFLPGAGAGAASFYGAGVNTYVTPEEAWARTKRKAHLIGVNPDELIGATGTRRIGR
jgi:hypothetical protein